ncbi:MAG: hypothetical protein ACKO43_00410, partial [Alphaproteobacteria bacterium]
MALRFSFFVFIALFATVMVPQALGATLRVGQHETFTRFVITTPQTVTHDIAGSTLRLSVAEPIIGTIPVTPPAVMSLKQTKQGDTTTLVIVFTHPIQNVVPKTMGSRNIFDVTLNPSAPVNP